MKGLFICCSLHYNSTQNLRVTPASGLFSESSGGGGGGGEG